MSIKVENILRVIIATLEKYILLATELTKCTKNNPKRVSTYTVNSEHILCLKNQVLSQINKKENTIIIII
jgi:hypothetical protein